MICWDYGVVAFVDILGFSSLIRKDSGSSSPKNLPRLLSALTRVREMTSGKRLDVRAFSDSIIVSASLSLQSVADVVESAVTLQRLLSRERVLVRGAIAFGKHFANEQVMYSEGLVEAYSLERERARFPRIVVGDSLLDWFFNHSELSSGLRDDVSSVLLTDRDGSVFLNYLEPTMIQDHARLVEALQRDRVSASVLEKFQWLAMYHNYFVGVGGGGDRIPELLAGSFRPYEVTCG